MESDEKKPPEEKPAPKAERKLRFDPPHPRVPNPPHRISGKDRG